MVCTIVGKKIFRYRLFFLFILISVITACAGLPEYDAYIPGLDEAILTNLETLITNGDTLQALQDIDTLRREEPEDDLILADLGPLEERALEDTGGSLAKALDDRQYDVALRLFRSLRSFDPEYAYKDITEQSLLLSLASEKAREGRDIPALMFFFKAATMGDVPAEICLEFGSLALAQQNRSALVKIAAMIEASGNDVPEEYEDMLKSSVSTNDLINGTVTIWVNRGMVLEGGVGYPERVVGSGFFIDRGGYVVTNYHVISSEVDPEYEGYSRLYIRVPENPELKIPAEVIGWNRIFDIALLKTELDPGYVFMFEEGVSCLPGDKIYAIGSPAGLERTITSGIVSAKDRELLQVGDAIQVDVPINQGNSGGPLLDSNGKLIGVVFAGIEQFEGVNFAIPSEWLVHIIPQLYRGGEVDIPWIGAMVVKARDGLEVMYVMPGSSAQRIGIQEGDMITRIAGNDVATLRDAHHTLLYLSPDTLTNIKWTRGEESMEGVVKLETRPFIPMETALDRDIRENLLVPLFGMKVEKSGKDGLEQTYLVKRIYSGFSADETGISPNDPFSIRNWIVEKDEGYAAVQIRIKKRKAGFLETVIQIAAYLETENFI